MMQTTLSHLHIYPIKSLQGISVDTAKVQQRGLELDRRWMITQTDGMFISQRKYPNLALIQLAVDEKGITLKATAMPDLNIDFAETTGKALQVQVWDDICPALEVSEKANLWLSEYLGIPLQLVYMPDDSERFVEADFNLNNNITSFSDGYPFLLISEASLEDLNTRLEEPVLMNRFRPNLVIRDCEAYAEDSWKKIRVGEVIFQVTKPCARCVFTTINQETAIKGVEPLKTLASYRRVGNKVLFGQNLLQENNGIIKVGDEVEILEVL